MSTSHDTGTRTPALNRVERARVQMHRHKVDVATTDAALTQLGQGRIGVAISGKLASGKDTIIAELTRRLGLETTRLAYGDFIKAELNQVLALLRQAENVPHAIRLLSRMDLTEADALRLVHLLGVSSDTITHDAWERADVTRDALQMLGTDIRRRQQDDYWVERMVRRGAERIADGRDLVVTDARFPDEMQALKDFGFVALRVDVTPQTQAARLLERDGLEPDPKRIGHKSEWALDDWDGFDIRQSNDGTLEDCIRPLVRFLTDRIGV